MTQYWPGSLQIKAALYLLNFVPADQSDKTKSNKRCSVNSFFNHVKGIVWYFWSEMRSLTLTLANSTYQSGCWGLHCSVRQDVESLQCEVWFASCDVTRVNITLGWRLVKWNNSKAMELDRRAHSTSLLEPGARSFINSYQHNTPESGWTAGSPITSRIM